MKTAKYMLYGIETIIIDNKIKIGTLINEL